MQQCREAFDVSLDKLHLIPNAVDVGKFRPAANGNEAPLTVTFVGRLEEWKGPHSFVQIAPASVPRSPKQPSRWPVPVRSNRSSWPTHGTSTVTFRSWAR